MQRTLLFCLAFLNAAVCALAQSRITTFAGSAEGFFEQQGPELKKAFSVFFAEWKAARH